MTMSPTPRPGLFDATTSAPPHASARGVDRARRHPEETEEPDGYGVLIVDDHEDNLFALEQILSVLGRPVWRASNGEQALRTVLRKPVAVMVLDFVMPDLDGLRVLHYLRGLDQTRHLPVVLVTGVGRDDGLAERACHLGAAGFLLKPVDPWALRAQVRVLADLYVRARRGGPGPVPAQPRSTP
ncbi:response regulator [Streptomyces sp. NPDC001941]|uniref:response regulator n=1 Tax=Streptomyces sp. NPDC001941 TaxID=3154659 RepID=UPI00332EF668